MNTVKYITSKIAREELKILMGKSIDVEQIQKLDGNNCPRKLYKYDCVNEYVLKNILNNELTATTPVLFNDLYDSTLHFDTYSENLNRINELNKSANELGYNCLIEDFDAKELLKKSDEVDIFKSTYLAKAFRVSSFSSKPCDTKMWSLYADYNRGICLEYSFNPVLHKIANFIYPVFYLDKPIEDSNFCDSDEKLNLAVLKSILSKAKDWEYEAEWRIVFYAGFNNNENRIQLIEIPKPTTILLGYKFMDDYCNSKIDDAKKAKFHKELLAYVKSNRINLKACKPKMKKYEIEFEDIKVDDLFR